MSAGFRSRWLGWTPEIPEVPPTPPPTEPTKAPFVGFVGALPTRVLKNHAPSCTSCASPVADPQDVLCQPCYLARRSTGRVLAFDPDRRRRTEARLAGRRCPSCGGSWWRVLPNGDAECEPCRRTRAVSSTPSSFPAGSVPDAPSPARASGPDRDGVSRGGAA